jgi:GNAT superfamily N-acetyltransferase
MKFRPFQPDDAAFCFRLRSSAVIRKFYGELTAAETAATVNAYLPDDYVRLARECPFFIGEKDDAPVAFFNLKRKSPNTAELPMIYIDLDCLGQGIGAACVDYMEEWLKNNWLIVDTLIVDTVIPKYNSGFYKSAGFVPAESTFCELSGLKIKALRLTKKIRN